MRLLDLAFGLAHCLLDLALCDGVKVKPAQGLGDLGLDLGRDVRAKIKWRLKVFSLAPDLEGQISAGRELDLGRAIAGPAHHPVL